MTIKFSANGLTKKFIDNGLMDEEGVYTVPESPVSLSDFQYQSGGAGILGGEQTLPDLGEAVLDMNTGELSNVSGTSAEISAAIQLTNEIMHLHNLLINEQNEVHLFTTFNVVESE